jgi:hypothetical protein
MINIEEIFNKNILIAVDESENASRAVSYVGRLLAGIGGFKILILHVIRQPDEDFFPTAAEKDQWLSQHKLKVDAMLKNYRKGLIEKGFAPTDVSVRSTLRYCPSLAECILAERNQSKCTPLWLADRGFHEAKSSSSAAFPVRSSTMHATARCGW